MATETHLTVGYSEIDHMGIVHHSCYPIWFEAGRHDYFKKAGVPNSKIRALGYFLPLTELKCEYRSPAKYKDEIIVVTNITYMSCVKVKFEYKVLNSINEKVLVTGSTVHVWTNRSVQPVNIEKEAPEIYRPLKKFAGL